LSVDLAGNFQRIFINRTDVYAVQLDSGGYVKVRQPLTAEVLRCHLAGETTIGAYQLNQEGKVKWLCFDIDPEHVKTARETAEKILESCLGRFHEKAVLLEASRYPDPSYHIWVFFDPEFPAKGARWIGYRVLELSGLSPREVEVFPKQVELTEELPYGNLIKLPLGLHKVAKRWSRFLDFYSFEPLPNEVIRDVLGIGFSDRDTEGIMSFREKRGGQTRFEMPKNLKSLPSQDEERAVQFLCKYWKRGYRNQLELSFLGWCIKKGISHESAYRIIREVTERTGDEERQDRLSLVDYHYQKRLDVPLKGRSGLRELIEEMAKDECD